MFIIYYHNVLGSDLDAFDPGTRMHVDDFRNEMEQLARHFRPVPLEALLSDPAAGRPDDRRVAVTFDDGYLGVMDHAGPVLQELGIPASVFVVTGHAGGSGREPLHFDEIEIAFRLTRRAVLDLAFLGGPAVPIDGVAIRAACMKRVKRRLKIVPEPVRAAAHQELLRRLDVASGQCREYAQGSPKYRTLDWPALRRMQGCGWTIGSHTRSHRALAQLDPADVRDELHDSMDAIRTQLGVRDAPFAYPYGQPEHIGPSAAAAVRDAGYTCGLTTVPGPHSGPPDLFRLCRGDGLASLAQFCGHQLRIRRRPAAPISPWPQGGEARTFAAHGAAQD